MAPVIAKVTTLPADLKAQAIAINSDPTLEKVQNFVSMMLHSASLVEAVVGGTFAFVATRWTDFRTTLKYNTTFIEPLLRPYLDIVSTRSVSTSD